MKKYVVQAYCSSKWKTVKYFDNINDAVISTIFIIGNEELSAEKIRILYKKEKSERWVSIFLTDTSEMNQLSLLVFKKHIFDYKGSIKKFFDEIMNYIKRFFERSLSENRDENKIIKNNDYLNYGFDNQISNEKIDSISPIFRKIRNNLMSFGIIIWLIYFSLIFIIFYP
ncbi:MAG: hypothetical protein NXI18_08925 [Alphaproteobacteria bacterium]|nr:hypothetical protein [Alphaproteobacteria bacterium]